MGGRFLVWCFHRPQLYYFERVRQYYTLLELKADLTIKDDNGHLPSQFDQEVLNKKLRAAAESDENKFRDNQYGREGTTTSPLAYAPE